MKNTHRLFFFPIIFLCSLFHGSIACKVSKKHISETECNEIFSNNHDSYLYLGKDISSIEKIITDISKLDMNPRSPVTALKKHIDDGFNVGLYDAVVETLEYAHLFLQQNNHKADPKQIKYLTKQIAVVMNQISEGELSINPTKKEQINLEKKRSMLEVSEEVHEAKKHKKHKNHKNTKVVDNLVVEHDAKIKNELTVKENAHFKDDIILKHSLYMHNSKNHKIGNVFKHKHRFIHNFGENNTFVGVDAGNFKMAGEDNSGFGKHALMDDSCGGDNTAVGSHALAFNKTGNANVAVGSRSLTSNVSGIDNVAVGANTLQFNQKGNGNTAVGNKSLEVTLGKNNTAIGRESLIATKMADGNTAVGAFTMHSNVSGQYNVALGEQSQYSFKTGDHNIGVGARTLYSNTSGINNVAIGGHALYSNTVNGNVAVGNRAMFSTTTGDSNCAMGRNTMINNTIGDSNTAIGSYAMEQNTTGRLNVAVGKEALRACTTGGENIAIGLRAGINQTTGNNGIYIGNLGVAAEHNTIRIGTITKQNKCFIQGIYQNSFTTAQPDVQVEVGTGKLGVLTSSAAFKENIEDLAPRYSEKLYDLRPVSFSYKHDASHTKNIGLLAEDVAKIYPELVIYDEQGKPFSICYKLLSILLLGEMQHLNDTMKTLQKNNDRYELLIQKLAQEIKTLTGKK